MIKTPLSTVIGGAFWTPGATVIGGASKTFNQLIKSLFANNEQGFAYDPNDLSTMFQDAAGTIPVTGVGQPVGLMLDKGRGLSIGALRFTTTDVDFANSWTPTAAVISRTKYSFTTNVGGGCLRSIPNVLGKPVKLRIKGQCTVPLTVRNGSNLDGSITIPAGSFDIVSNNPAIFYATATLYFYLNGAGTLTLELITIEDVAGNHAYQNTSSMRPLLVASPQRLDYDTADDNLITTLPAQLTGCTVIRSVPNVGAQILTGQTIPATYNDNTDHCGLIVINRALTATETSQITKLFNKAAGV